MQTTETEPLKPQNNTDGKKQKGFYAALIAMVVPMALQNLMNVAINAGDTIMLSFYDQNALSAASLAGQVQFVMVLIFFGISAGSSVLTAQYWGKGDKRSIEKVASIALRFCMLVAFIFFLASMLIPGLLMQCFTREEAIIKEGIIYLRYLAPSFLFMAFTNNYLIILRSLEKVKFAAVLVGISLFTDLALNYAFIFGFPPLGIPRMGSAGAALTTTICRGVELIVVVIYASHFKDLRLRIKDYITLDKDLFADFFKYSTPTILNEFGWGMGATLNVVILGHLGSDVVASNSVNAVLRQLATVVVFGIANAAAIFVGKEIGASRIDNAKKYSGRMFKLASIAGVLGAALILLIRPLVLHLMSFSLSAQATKYLGLQMLFMAVAVVALSINSVGIIGIFRGGGDTKFAVFADVVPMWLVSIPLSALAAFVWNWPVEVVLALIVFDEIIKIPLVLFRYKSGRWLNSVTR